MELTISKYLESVGYRFYPETKIEYPYVDKALYQKRAESLIVCETNDRLCINIDMAHFAEGQPSYTIGVRAEIGGLWWTLEAYSLNEAELLKNLESIESSLLQMVNNVLNPERCDATKVK